MNEQLKKLFVKNNANGLLLHSEINRNWFLNFNSSFGFLLIGKKSAILITDSRYYQAAKKEIKKAKVWCISKDETLIDLLTKAKKELGVSDVLVEEEYTTLSTLRIINQVWNGKHIIPFISKKLREIKTAKEIKMLQKSADIIVKTMRWIWEVIRPGMTEIDVAQMLSIKMISFGADKNSFDPIVAAGINGANPHHHPSDYKLKDGDMVTIDIGCMYKGYASDMTRTFVLGKKCNTPEMVDIYKTVLKAQTAGIKAATTNISGNKLDEVCRGIIDKTDYHGLFNHGTGHGVGLEVHELPNVNITNNKKFKNNNVITIEPGIYHPKFGGVRIEDTIVIKNKTPIVLTKNCPKILQFINYKSNK